MKKEFYEIVTRSLAGESSQQEEEWLAQELEANQDAKKSVQKLRYFWTNYFPANGSTGSIKERTLVKMGNKPQKVARFERAFRRISAAIIIFGISVFLSVTLINRYADNSITEYVSNTGEVKKVLLPDGSKVWLNSRSSVAYHKKFLGRQRQVVFHGEGYFEVESDNRKPFVVSMPDLNVKVHGTAFSVSSYYNEKDIEVVLDHGSVEIVNKLDNNRSTFLKPGNKAVLNKMSGILKVDKNNNLDIGWMEGRMIFYNSRFADITNKLERKYGVEIILLDMEVEDLRFTAEFDNEKLDDILKLMNRAHEMLIRKQGDKYFISKNNKYK